MKKSAGFSLLEVLIALIILNIGMSALYLAWDHNFRIKQGINNKNRGAQELLTQVELLRKMPSPLVDSSWEIETEFCQIQFQLNVLDEFDFEELFFEAELTEETLKAFENRAQEAQISMEAPTENEQNCFVSDTLYFSRIVP